MGSTRIFMKMTSIPQLEDIYKVKIQNKNVMACKIQRAWRVYRLLKIVRKMFVKKMKIKFRIKIFRRRILKNK
jgi:myosin heavy subunit